MRLFLFTSLKLILRHFFLLRLTLKFYLSRRTHCYIHYTSFGHASETPYDYTWLYYMHRLCMRVRAQIVPNSNNTSWILLYISIDRRASERIVKALLSLRLAQIRYRNILTIHFILYIFFYNEAVANLHKPTSPQLLQIVNIHLSFLYFSTRFKIFSLNFLISGIRTSLVRWDAVCLDLS